jgi:hypothetical protein
VPIRPFYEPLAAADALGAHGLLTEIDPWRLDVVGPP